MMTPVDRTSLISLTTDLNKARVLCLGDVMLDRFVQGTVERISPEAPIPVLNVSWENNMLGGAGNVVRNITALGAQVHFISAVGNDEAGFDVTRLVGETRGAKATLVNTGLRPTSVKTRFIAGQQQMLRTDWESSEALEAAQREELLSAMREHIGKCDVVVLSDYGKGLLTNGAAADFIALANDAGKPVIVDPKGTDYAIYAGAALITPNRKELAEATGMAVNDDGSVIAAAQWLIDQYSFGAVLATRSQDGMTLVRSDGHVTHLKAEAKEVFDVSGAGDTVVACMSVAMGIGAALEEGADLANVAAGIVVSKTGTAAAYINDVVTAIHHRDIMTAEAKVLDIESLKDQVDLWRRRGLKVGFTNGCFDLLHPGHLSLLHQASLACDKLIVGLNSDASVERLKGPTRPIQGEAARSAVLASLGMVDAVVIFDEDTPMKVIEALLPDILVKGADYTEDQVVGGSVVKAAGGKVVLANLEPGHSTTNTIARLSSDHEAAKKP